MHAHIIRHSLLGLALLLSACSSSKTESEARQADPSSQFVGSGTLDITGTDSTALGNTLTVGDAVLYQESTGELFAWTFLDELSIISGIDVLAADQAPLPTDFVFGDDSYYFIFTVIDDPSTLAQGVSMAVFVNGQKYSYSCAGLASSGDCGEIVVDRSAQTIDFIDFEVEPALSDNESVSTSPLVLNGRLSWFDAQ